MASLEAQNVFIFFVSSHLTSVISPGHFESYVNFSEADLVVLLSSHHVHLYAGTWWKCNGILARERRNWQEKGRPKLIKKIISIFCLKLVLLKITDFFFYTMRREFGWSSSWLLSRYLLTFALVVIVVCVCLFISSSVCLSVWVFVCLFRGTKGGDKTHTSCSSSQATS